MLQKLRLGIGGRKEKKVRAFLVLQPASPIGFQYEWKEGQKGPKVVNVTPGGPADLAGLRGGEVILSINGKRMVDVRALMECVHGMKLAGGNFEIEYCAPHSAPTTPVFTSSQAPSTRNDFSRAASTLLRRKQRSLTQPPDGRRRASFDFPKSLIKPLLEHANVSGCKSKGLGPAPHILEIVCQLQRDVEGTYVHRGELMNGSAMWKSENGKRLYCTKSGLWALVDVEDGPKLNIALVSSRVPARGRMPHLLHWAEWHSWSGDEWRTCPVRVEELRIDTTDGRCYWKGAFMEFYGESLGETKWEQALSKQDHAFELAALKATTGGEGLNQSLSSLPSLSSRDSCSLDDSIGFDEVEPCTESRSTYVPPAISSIMKGAS